MIHAIDRDSGLFTRSTADKINKKTTQLWKNINDMSVPTIEYKETVNREPFSWAQGLNTNKNFALVDDNFCIAGHLHIVNLSVQLNGIYTNWVRIGDLVTPVLSTMFIPGPDGSFIVRIAEGSSEVQLLSFDTAVKHIYFFYIT